MHLTVKLQEGDAAIHLTTEDGDLEATRVLLSAGCDVNVARNNGCTPLHLAAEEGYPDIVKALVDAGADLHAQDSVASIPNYG